MSKRVGVMDFSTNTHKVYSVLAYFDFELNNYQVSAHVATPTTAELSTIAAISDVKQQLDPYIFEDGEELPEPEPEPEAWRTLNYPSAFDYWDNPGVANLQLTDLAFEALEISIVGAINDQIMKRVIVPAGSKIRFRLQDGTFVVLRAVALQTGGVPPTTLEFEVIQLQAPDGTIIPLVRSDLTDDWAALVVSNPGVAALIVDRLSSGGVNVIRIGGTAGSDENTLIECEAVGDELRCTVTPVPKSQ
ncbi:MAG: hypothetical protein AAFS02_11070 [Pseudomonadota bacterium]